MCTSLSPSNPIYVSEEVSGTVTTLITPVVIDEGDEGAALWSTLVIAIFVAVFFL